MIIQKSEHNNNYRREMVFCRHCDRNGHSEYDFFYKNEQQHKFKSSTNYKTYYNLGNNNYEEIQKIKQIIGNNFYKKINNVEEIIKNPSHQLKQIVETLLKFYSIYETVNKFQTFRKRCYNPY